MSQNHPQSSWPKIHCRLCRLCRLCITYVLGSSSYSQGSLKCLNGSLMKGNHFASLYRVLCPYHNHGWATRGNMVPLEFQFHAMASLACSYRWVNPSGPKMNWIMCIFAFSHPSLSFRVAFKITMSIINCSNAAWVPSPIATLPHCVTAEKSLPLDIRGQDHQEASQLERATAWRRGDLVCNYMANLSPWQFPH